MLTKYDRTAVKFYEMLSLYSTKDVARETIDKLVEKQAFMLSTNDLAFGAAWIFLLMIPISFLCKRNKKNLYRYL